MSFPPPEAAAAESTRAPSWSAQRLLSSPHRLCFFWAGVQWAVSAGWWAAELLAGPRAGDSQHLVPLVAWHGLWFSLGAMPLFVAGFVFTAGPRWLHTTPIGTRQLCVGVGLFSAGWLLALPLTGVDARAVAAMLLAAAIGQSLLVERVLALLRTGRSGERVHVALITIAMAAMALTLLAAALALATGCVEWLQPLAQAGLWCGPVLVFVAASHRMLPFLGDGLWPALDRGWPHWPLWLLVSLVPVQAVGALLPNMAPLPPWLRFVGFGHLVVVCVASAGLTLRWVGHPAMRTPMLRMLFGAALWWLLALLLLTAAALPALSDESARRLGLAGLHALGMGYLGGTLLTMATRVSAAHQGIARAIDGVARLLYMVLQTAVLARLCALLWPQAASVWLPAAAVAWSFVTAVWLLRHGRWLGQPPRARSRSSQSPIIAAIEKR